MDAHQLQAFLLKLYASDKGEHQLGMFGVGFWSILLFEPEAFFVDTSRGEEHHLLQYKQGRDRPQLRRLEPAAQGTTIILHRPAPRGDEWSAILIERLVYYCAHVMTLQGENPDAPQGLRLSFNGVPCNRAMAVQGTWVESLRQRHAFGLVGFGEQPLVRLYKGGILLREAKSLAELWPSRPGAVPKLTGLHPQIVVNCPGLNVLLDRRTIAEDAALAELMLSCEQALLSLSRRMLDAVAPLDLANASARLMRKDGRALLLAVLLFALLAASAFLFARRGREAYETPSLTRVLDAYKGPRLDDPHLPPTPLAIRSEGPSRLQLVLGMAEHFDPARGWLPMPGRSSGPYPAIERPADGALAFQVSNSPLPLLLPTPLLGSLLADSVTLNGRPYGELRLSERGDPLLFGSGPITGTLHYQFVLGKTTLTGPRLSTPAPVSWPAELLPWLRGSENLMPAQWPLWFIRQLRGRFRSADQAMELSAADWLSAVFAQDQADCDIMNGLLTLLLNAKGLDARLALGMVLEDGRPRGHLHAWTVYREHRRWFWQDASHPLPSFHFPAPSLSPDPPAAGPPLAGPPVAGPPVAGPLVPGPSADGEARGDDAAQTGDPASGSAEAYEPPAGFDKVLLLSLFASGIFFLAFAVLIALRRRTAARSRAVGAGEWQFAAAWLVHSLRTGQEHAEVLFRPLLRLANGAHISAHQVMRRARRGPLYCGKPATARPRYLLDCDCPVLAAIAPFLPELLDERLGFAPKRAGDALRLGEGALSLGEWEAGWQILLPPELAPDGAEGRLAERLTVRPGAGPSAAEQEGS
jgi:hypothetical protein